MKKPVFSVEDIKNLLIELEKVNEGGSEHHNIVTEALSFFVLNNNEELPIEAYQYIAAEAYTLEQRAKILRTIVRAFKKPMTEIPKDINNQNKIISYIARWRLKLGK